MEKGQYIEAVNFFDRCLHWYTPFNPYVNKSAERLWEISKLAEEKGDIRLAMIAVRNTQAGVHFSQKFLYSGEGLDYAV